MKAGHVDFGKGSITGNIIRTSLPMLAAQVLNLLYNIVDRIYIARIPGEGTAALGAVGLCFPVIILVTAFTNLYGSGGAPLFAMELGRGDAARAKRILGTTFFLLLMTAAVLTVLGEASCAQVLTLFGASEDALAYAVPYLRIYLLGTVFSMLSTGLNPYINAQGYPLAGMLTVVIGAGLNIALDPLFIFVFGLGVRGAAWATILSQAVSAAAVLGFLTGKQAEIRLHLPDAKERRENLPIAGQIVSLGLTSFVMQFSNALVSACCNRVLLDIGGDIYVTVMTIVSSVRQICETPVFSLSEGTSPILSYNFGARNAARVRRSMAVMTILMFAYSLAIWVAVRSFPGLFISIFSADAAVHDVAVPALHLYFFAFVFQTFQMTGQTVFKSLNKKKRAIFFSLFRKVVMVVPLTFLLPYAFGLGTDGVFLAEPVSNVVGGLACFTTMILTILPELKAMETAGNA